MRSRRSVIAFALAGSLVALAAGQARAGVEMPFDQAAFAESQRAGKPILVDVTASWCPTCAKQRPILARLREDPAFRDLQVYTVDFDTRKDVLRAMGVQMQSTLIVFHGDKEVGRSTGVVDEAAIRALLDKSKG